ncbi:efflux RND transporter periplasmic adaptor subunit [Sinomicrobium soli]|uniref:efflux RND transporter periplasmic adaptor subunit n=1 Tax=Sinomicrobium sp. N-1-3-6 TaxID=2219864 RepID=UPI000DCE083A|nr:efflux RND transporter periplasmic adaptor subunit [Sinomicrobium sp. N-1-3-6]RAV30945.1 efflux transporter periplasmic adaptor subunit [Sinomicrobium sp. N-1-3-6]
MKKKQTDLLHKGFFLGFALLLVLLPTSCREKEEEDLGVPLPVLTLKEEAASETADYLGYIEGIVNVEVRPQVEGILEEIYVDEGDFVEKGQKLFKVNELPYLEDLKNARANVELEKARLQKAQTELNRLTPLIENEVISEVRMQTAQADYKVAQSSLARAEAEAASMQINLEFTEIKAPVSGYIGRIPKRIGNLVGKGDSQPLTVLSDIHEVYFYFSMSESDYLFYEKVRNDTLSKKLNPNVKLILADGDVYERPGRIDASVGQVDRSTGTITLRAKFDNPDALLRSGSTGKIMLEQEYPEAILVPQEATITIQDKNFVFVLDDQNKAVRKEIGIEGISGKNYIIKKTNLSTGDRVVTSGLDKITDGMKVNPIEKGKFLLN